MTVYQLHETSGKYEYYTDRIIGTYLYRIDAETIMARCKEKEKKLAEHGKRCRSCPLFDYYTNFHSIDEVIKSVEDYCSLGKQSIISTDKCEYDCTDCHPHWDDCDYYIEAVEVIEDIWDGVGDDDR